VSLLNSETKTNHHGKFRSHGGSSFHTGKVGETKKGPTKKIEVVFSGQKKNGGIHKSPEPEKKGGERFSKIEGPPGNKSSPDRKYSRM